MTDLNLPRLIAHRGASEVCPENTIPAMSQAAKLGATWVECDCRLSSDNHAVIMHDRTLQRTTDGRGRVDQKSLLQLQRFRVLSKHNTNSAIKIPTLRELLQVVCQHNLGLNLEIKTPFKHIEIMCREVQQALSEAPVNESKFLISFSSDRSLKFMQRNIDVNYGLVVHRWPRNWRKKFLNKNLYSVHLNYKILTAERVKMLNAAGLKVLAYTVNNKVLADKLYKWGVISVFSDNLQLIAERD